MSAWSFRPTGGPENECALLHDGQCVGLVWQTSGLKRQWWTNGRVIFTGQVAIVNHYIRHENNNAAL